MSIVSAYLTELRTIRNLGAGVAETTYYGPLSTLFNAVGKSLKPKVLCLLHLQNTGAGIPDAGFFSANQIQRTTGTAVPGQPPSRGVLEAKPFNVNINTLASSQQVLTYLKHYNQVLITNLREFQLLVLENGVPRKVEEYKLAVSTEALFVPATLQQHETLFPEFLERVLRRQSVITDPGDLAWFLASYAREGRARVETHGLTSFDTIKSALEQSLGLTFEGEKGLHFFRSTLVQTLFYGIFSAWVIWCRTDGFSQSARFDWRTSASYLNVPVLRKLFNEVADPGPLNAIQLTEMLSLAGDTLARVDRSAFFSRFSEADAVQYFYEPFLEAFDPELRKDLGVWYTPREIVRYMVERIDHLLRTELGQVDGLASPDVCVLDPCCGTGAYLTEVLDRIHRTLKLNAGDDDAYVASDVRTAALTRIFGFEILPAPFVIAHLQLAAQLQQLGAPLTGVQRAGVYLTNSLTGWVPEQEPKKSIFPDLQKEKEDAEAVKRRANILVILGNPPYNGYSGISRMQEERDLSEAYRSPVVGVKAPEGQGLNELYVRFFRVAERRIAANLSGRGIVSFITNYSWLDGLSHPTMRHTYLNVFQHLYIDNLNGDKYRTGKTTPDGKPDPSVFSTPQNREGIQPGTAIATLVRNSAVAETTVSVRDLWGAGKLSHLLREANREFVPEYTTLVPVSALGLPFAHRVYSIAFTTWPRIQDLFPWSSPGVKTSRDSFVVDIDFDVLQARLTSYLDEHISDSEMKVLAPSVMTDGAGYDAKAVRAALQLKAVEDEGDPSASPKIDVGKIHRYIYRPFDLRWIYWEPETALLDRKREDFFYQVSPGRHWVEVRQREAGDTFSRGTVSGSLSDQFGNGMSHFIPNSIKPVGNLYNSEEPSELNLSSKVREVALARGYNEQDLFPHALAILHTPAYRMENAGALLGDWPRVPLPSTNELLAQSAILGRKLLSLLDPETAVKLPVDHNFFAALKRPKDAEDKPDLYYISGGWGSRGQGNTVMPGRGKFETRPWTAQEIAKLHSIAAQHSIPSETIMLLLGESCVDARLNDVVFWSAIPVNVWDYTLGGYQVLKKWLSYREGALLGRPLRIDEVRYFAEVVRRITSILLLGPALNSSYASLLPEATPLL